MPRASKRQTELARLKELLDSAREVGEQRRQEINELRKAARQLMAGLTEYAKQENWAQLTPMSFPEEIPGKWFWKNGEGPDIARKYLGLDEPEERN